MTGRPGPLHGVSVRLNALLERRFPERRVFVRSDSETRFIRLTPAAQAIALTGSVLLVGWTILASAIVFMDSIGSGSLREQAERERLLYEERLNRLSQERDRRAEEARLAQERFNTALAQVSRMQSALLASEDRREELERGIEAVQVTLRRTIAERDEARRKLAALQAPKPREGLPAEDFATTVDFLTAALGQAAEERDMMALMAEAARQEIARLEEERRLIDARNDRIFEQLEDAVALSLVPLDKMFRSAGLPTEDILRQLKATHSGQGGPLTPLVLSTKGSEVDPDSMRANAILEQLDRLNLYRIAAEKVPFAIPLRSAFRYTSGFGMRWGRPHKGTDFAAAYGTPIYATADGVVTHAGWASGYGRLVKIQHEFGVETRYAHLSSIAVRVGQRVSRGDRIGAMGNSGRSTGTHLHYEVRINGEAVNPMVYIKAANDVF
ncbi:Murein DD-endopeptidase MepM and murein hydrolase activator NlpD, contain LysM domain [Meinhardsimonia xiamenensis]|jgi:murein DD-endopeptidase MepM/ murein hydrolase activator NlpD|uniref:Murein DD-endopeptidase MepM and murein hydrolase activator NlpD, contain LysM domain n=1 Tax=Meinhardsimonia xiamenensis TaxID=990712 RepID=A0A1G9GGN4_9RHOB|nr:M23 family metallopeptidase [Meinhardsimonia xiamenensis]PRX31893.1 murein DD-endopeptidase MepM/ murein hydrolase activator NlpD [Meinhardsimonia xiamenensis]SDK99858.1 Murein DD-endopeptidase MepM and murein hydrolase activator NlpD, contain LysM domain [Meinhardsimonia xiamenensis]